MFEVNYLFQSINKQSINMYVWHASFAEFVFCWNVTLNLDSSKFTSNGLRVKAAVNFL